MMLTDLDVAARKSGLPVIETSGWTRRGVGPMVRVNGVTCHHTATPASAKGDLPTLNVLISGHGSLRGPLCNLALSRSGVVYVIAAGYANHAGVSHKTSWTNRYMIGIEAEHPGGNAPWTDQQYDAYVALCAALVGHYKIPVDQVLGHKETAAPAGRKPDPTFNAATFRQQVAAWEGLDMTKDELRAILRSEVPGLVDKAMREYRNDSPSRGVLSALLFIQKTALLMRGDATHPGHLDGNAEKLDRIAEQLQQIADEVSLPEEVKP